MSTPPRRALSTAGAEITAPAQPPSEASALAAAIKALMVAGERDAARERFADLVAHQQRRALRIAYVYLRDAHDADEAVQDAFVKVFTHITSYREHLPFEVWFTRILVNGCLDMRKSRARRLRWALPMSGGATDTPPIEPAAPQPSIEQRLVADVRNREIVDAIGQLPGRQRAVFTLCHLGDHSTAEVSHALGLSEATVRVHLFRAIRRLRLMLARQESEA